MNWETALSPTLEQTFNIILSSLANFFGTSTETILANAPEWLAKYGWYVTLYSNLSGWLAVGAFIGVLLASAYLTIWVFSEHKVGKWSVVISLGLFILGAVFVAAIPIVTCYIAPEIVGLEAIIQLISK